MSQTINININNFSSTDFASPNQNQFQLPRMGLNNVVSQISTLLERMAKSFESLGSSQGFHGGNGGCGCASKPAPINPPIWQDGCHPKNSLKTEGNVITTPGGYKIEMQGQFDWKITGPDGKKTEIWGDPHVREGDGGNWDFKRNSIFKLPDGTEIKCNTVPYANGMTVTGSLDISCGNDHIKVSDIDKGIGKIGVNQADGNSQLFRNSFSGLDTFVMGKESDDWSFTGKEVIGSNNGGDSFNLGNNLAPGSSTRPNLDNFSSMLENLMNKLLRNGLSSMQNQQNQFNNQFHPYRKPAERTDPSQDSNPIADNGRQEIIGGIRDGIRNLNRALKVLSKLANLSTSMNGFRNRGFYA
jgi:Domain of Unknown Function (DUF1521)